MDEPLYNIVINGTLTGEFDDVTACRNLATLLHIDESRARTLLSGREHIIKRGVTEVDSLKYLIRLAEAGHEASLQEVVSAEVVPEKEHRFSGERRQRLRRPPRPGAIIVDRRRAPRRTAEVRQFRRLVITGSTIPLPMQAYAPQFAARA